MGDLGGRCWRYLFEEVLFHGVHDLMFKDILAGFISPWGGCGVHEVI